jgi:hypothetical protein
MSVELKRRGTDVHRCGAKRLVSTFVEKEFEREICACPGEGRDWASAPHSGGFQSHVLSIPHFPFHIITA